MRLETGRRMRLHYLLDLKEMIPMGLGYRNNAYTVWKASKRLPLNSLLKRTVFLELVNAQQAYYRILLVEVLRPRLPGHPYRDAVCYDGGNGSFPTTLWRLLRQGRWNIEPAQTRGPEAQTVASSIPPRVMMLLPRAQPASTGHPVPCQPFAGLYSGITESSW